jgi:N-acetylneuraminic acid mutarotase
MIKRTPFILIIALALGLGTDLHAQANNWVKKSGFAGTKRERAVGIAIGMRAYVGFGHDSGIVTRSDWWEYDPGSDSWSQKASMPGGGRRDAVGFAIGTKGYVGTGDNSNDAQLGTPLSDFWMYDPALNTWTPRAPYPGAGGAGIYYAAAFTCSNGRGYVCGGKNGPNQYWNQLWEYNPATDTWAQRAPFPGGPRYSMSAFAVGNTGYVGLGVDFNILRQDMWKYNATTNQWVQVANFPGSARYSASAFSLGPEGFIVCGNDGGYKDDLWEYSTLYNVWAQRSDLGGDPRRSAVAFSIANKGFCGTGLAVVGSKRDMYEYTPLPPMGLEDIREMAGFNLFPNPMSSSAQLVIRSGLYLQDAAVYIYDTSGKLHRKLPFSGTSCTLYRESLEAGIYFVSVADANGLLSTSKMIIQ